MIVRIHLKHDLGAAPAPVRRPVPWLVSMMVHGSLLTWLVFWPEGVVKKSPSAYEQLFKGREDKIILYQFKEKLPDVKPLKSADKRPPRAEVKIAKQSIVSSPKNAPKERQMVWTPAPELKDQPKVPLPNILAVQMSQPAPPERKKFAPEAAKPKVEAALAQPKVVDTPQTLAADVPNSKLLEQLGALPKPNRVQFTVPPKRVNAAVAKVGEMESPPAAMPDSMAANGPSLSQLNIAVVGLDPGPKDRPLPDSSHAAEFSAGPKLNPRGGAGEGDPNASVSVPDLMVKGAGSDAKPTLLALTRVAPTSAEALRGMSKYSAPSPPAEAPHPAAAKVTSAPNPRFEGREVYSMAIQMPNITSYVGSWLMWYAGRGMTHEGPLAPPVAHRKVDPKYIATAVAERIEGRVQLLCVIDKLGHVDRVEIVRGLDPRLDQSATEALSKWEFDPATRGGVPVDVDVMVEIPFRLPPKAPR